MANFLTSEFWFVTKVPHSATSPVIEDIVFKCTIPELELQFKGGLKRDEIIGIYDNEDAAISKGTLELWRWRKTKNLKEKLERLTGKKVSFV
jgi:hypothetical protein